MKIVRVEQERTAIKVRADLARLSAKGSRKFISYSTVAKYLAGVSKEDREIAEIIINSNRSVAYVEKFAKNNVPIRKSHHIVALLCIFSEDSFGSRVLADEFFDYEDELQERLDECAEHSYNGVLSAVTVMDFLGHSGFLEGDPFDVWFLLYNFFLHKEGLCLILEDTDLADTSPLMTMKYKVENYVNRIRS